MTSRLSMHKQLAAQDFWPSVDWIRAVKPTIVKVISPDPDFCREVKRVSPGTLILARDIEDSGSPDDKAWRYQGRSDWQYIDIIEGRNEVPPRLGDEGQAQADYELRLCHKAHWHRKKYCALSWGEGNPSDTWWNDLTQWAEFLDIWGPVLRAADYIGLHEYWWPRWSHPDMLYWHTHRSIHWYPKLPADMCKPVIISEANLDGDINGAQPGAGWREIYTPQQWAAEMVSYERSFLNPSMVVAIMIYDWWGTPDWERFRWNDAGDALRDKILAQGEGETMPELEIVDLRQTTAFNSGFTRTIGQIRGMCVHHTGNAAVDANQVAFIQRMTDVSYHYLIGRDGKIYQLNGIEEVVWHAADGTDGPSNRGDVAVSFIGLLMDGVRPNAAQFQSFRDLWAMLRGQGIGAGLVSHKQAKPAHDTACPGDWWPLDASPPAGLTGGAVEPAVPPSSEPTTPPADTVLARVEALEKRVDSLEYNHAGFLGVLKALVKAIQDAGL